VRKRLAPTCASSLVGVSCAASSGRALATPTPPSTRAAAASDKATGRGERPSFPSKRPPANSHDSGRQHHPSRLPRRLSLLREIGSMASAGAWSKRWIRPEVSNLSAGFAPTPSFVSSSVSLRPGPFRSRLLLVIFLTNCWFVAAGVPALRGDRRGRRHLRDAAHPQHHHQP
jgi:hypothetical protein